MKDTQVMLKKIIMLVIETGLATGIYEPLPHPNFQPDLIYLSHYRYPQPHLGSVTEPSIVLPGPVRNDGQGVFQLDARPPQQPHEDWHRRWVR